MLTDSENPNSCTFNVWSDTISGTDNCNTFKIQTKV